MKTFDLTPIGHVASSLGDPAEAPRQGDEGAPDTWLNIDSRYLEALEGLKAGDHVLVLTWLDRARRDVLVVHPRDDPARPIQGVFSTRSADRPNPIGLHRVQVLEVENTRVRVRDFEAVDGTPVLDLKPVLGAVGER
jgi:tRNA-Thr(GGU) m(6)t(6)A37 methyltransferase TsaA